MRTRLVWLTGEVSGGCCGVVAEATLVEELCDGGSQEHDAGEKLGEMKGLIKE